MDVVSFSPFSHLPLLFPFSLKIPVETADRHTGPPECPAEADPLSNRALPTQAGFTEVKQAKSKLWHTGTLCPRWWLGVCCA